MNFDDLLIQLEKELLEHKDYLFLENSDLVCCWEKLSCEKKSCPAYGKVKSRCWQQIGTLCTSHMKTYSFSKKLKQCLECDVFLDSTKKKNFRTLEAIHNILFLINVQDPSYVVGNRKIMKNIDAIVAQYAFTQSEVVISSQLLANESRANIAKRLGVTGNTLKTHIRNLFRKADVHSLEKLRECLLKFAEQLD